MGNTYCLFFFITYNKLNNVETTIYINTEDKPYLCINNRNIFLNCTYDGEYHANRKLMVRQGIKPAVIAYSIANTFGVPFDSEFVRCSMQVINQFL